MLAHSEDYQCRPQVLLAYFDNNHYDSVWERKERYSTAYCQSKHDMCSLSLNALVHFQVLCTR